jgi:putative phosphoribosyl transferase
VILTVHQYRNRTEAGRVLGRHLAHYAGRVDALVLALPKGGVPIAVEVASYLNAPLDAFIVRRLTLPGNSDYTLGAIAADGISVLDDEAIQAAGVTSAQLATITAREMEELARQELYYRGRRAPSRIAGRVVILVDDGLATGLSMHAAVIALHRQRPAWLVVAAPVGSPEICEELAEEVHELVCPLRPTPFQSIGLWYDHFAPIDDEEVRIALQQASALPRS